MKTSNNTRNGAALPALILLALLVATPAKVFGYADPGTGSFVYQAVYAAFIGGAFYFRKLVRKFRGKRDEPTK